MYITEAGQFGHTTHHTPNRARDLATVKKLYLERDRAV